MECRRIKITLISASSLEDVRALFQMKVYAVASIADKEQTKRRTHTDRVNEINPAWNYTINYTIDEQALHQDGVMLVVKLYCERTLGDRYIGEVRISIKELYDHAQANGGGGGGARLTKSVQNRSAVSQGALTLSCTFGERVIIEEAADMPGEEVIIEEEASRRRVRRRGRMILTAVSALCGSISIFVGSDDDAG